VGTPRVEHVPWVEDLWEKDAYAQSGERLGRIEAVGMGRYRVPRRVGVRARDDRRRLRFYELTGASISGDRVVLASERPLRVLRGVAI
jgi:hypothetical protein